MSRLLAAAVITVMLTAPTPGQRLGAARGRDRGLVRTANFGALLPHSAGAMAAIELPMRLSIPRTTAAHGYQISAIGSLSFTPVAASAGGRSLTASDIGVGITSVSSAAGANTQVVIAAGFDYDPASVTRNNGSSPYTGAAAGRATLTDLLSGRAVLRAEKIPGSRNPPDAVDLNLTLKLAMSPQFFTPGGFSGTITLIVTD